MLAKIKRLTKLIIKAAGRSRSPILKGNVMLVKMKINGIELIADTNEMHESWIAACLEYGVRRKVQDTYSKDKGKEKLDLVKAMLKEMQSGEEMSERQRVTRASLDPVMTMALKDAKQSLTDMFKRVTGEGKAIDMAKHPKVAPFYKVTEDRAVWIDDSVIKWIEKQKEMGKRDYVEEAAKQIALLDDEDIDLEDMLDL